MASYIISISNSLDDTAAQSRITSAGGVVTSSLSITNTYNVDCTAEQLAAMSDVVASSLNDDSIAVAMTAGATFNGLHHETLLYRRREVQNGESNVINYRYDGSGVDVYLLDTGVNASHVEFGNPSSLYNLHSAYDNFDDNAGHGTAMASLLIGTGLGVSPQCTLHNVKIFDALSGNVTIGQIVDGLNAVMADHQANTPTNPKVVCCPWTVPQNDLLDDVFDSLNASNLVIVAAAGNDGVAINTKSPAGIEKIITVGAFNDQYTVASFTNTPGTGSGLVNYGNSLDIFALGVNVDVADSANVSNYVTYSGTSISCATTAGVVAQTIQKDSSLDSSEVKEALLAEGHSYGQSVITFPSGGNYSSSFSAITLAEKATDPILATEQSGRLVNVQHGSNVTVDIGLNNTAANVEILDFAPLSPWMGFDAATGIVSINGGDATCAANLAPGVYTFALKGELGGDVYVEEYSVGLYTTDVSEVTGEDSNASQYYYDTDSAEYDEIINYSASFPSQGFNEKP